MASKIGLEYLKTYEAIKEQVFNWNIREEDVWVCSYPKTGTNWMLELSWLLLNDLDYEKAKTVSINTRCPHLECPALMKMLPPNQEETTTDRPLELYDPVKFIEMSKKPMCIKTHLLWNQLPKQIQDGTKKPKVIYMTRNPYDTLLSLHHFTRSYMHHRGTIDESIECFLLGKRISSAGTFWDHVLSYWPHRNLPNVLIVHYEDMHRDLQGVIEKVAAFLERPVKKEDIGKLAEHLSFDSMKSSPALNFVEGLRFKRNDSHLYRSGKVGSYKDELTEDQIELLKRMTEEKFKDIDFEITK